MTVGAMKKLLGAANVFGALGVIALLLYMVRPSSALQPVHKRIQPGSVTMARRSVSKRRAEAEYKACWTKGVPQPDMPSDTAASQAGLPADVSRYKFYSAIIIKSSKGNESFAEISNGSEERLYSEKEKVGEYLLAEILPERVILEKGGKTFTLDRTESPVITAPARAKRSASPGTRGRTSRGRSSSPRPGDGNRPRVVHPGTSGPGSEEGGSDDETSRQMRPEDAPTGTTAARRLIIPAKEKDYIVENFPKILHEVKLQTELEKDGSMSGVKVGYVKSGSVLSRVGRLRSGDIIRKVNGTPVNSIQQAVSLYEQLTKQNVQNVDVEIERKGQVFTHNYSIAGSGR
jgi:type II secretory pathway component PulC